MKNTKSFCSKPPFTPMSCRSKLGSTSKVDSNIRTGTEIDEECFFQNFENVPPFQVHSGKDVDNCLKKCHKLLSDKTVDWESRVECLKSVRSLIIGGGLQYDEFHKNLSQLQHSFQSAIDDLRSMVVREACITVAFMSKNIKNRLDCFIEAFLNDIINLMQKSQKVFVCSGLVCVRFILQNTHSPRLIPIIARNMDSKAKDIRRACIEFVSLILQTWKPLMVERHAAHIQDAIKKGIVDADERTRSHAREAYAEFAVHFPDKAEALKTSLDVSYRKLLLAGSNNNSTSSLNKCAVITPRCGYPGSYRSNSAIDIQALEKVQSRSLYSVISRQKLISSASTSKTGMVHPASIEKVIKSMSRINRPKNRISISQPSSRSSSPSALSPVAQNDEPSLKYTLLRELDPEMEHSIEDIILCCTSLDSDKRRDALIELQNYIRAHKLEFVNLKEIVDVLLETSNSPHIRTCNLVLDVLNDLIVSQSTDLCFCLYSLFTFLFVKLERSLLKSVTLKITKILDIILNTFPRDLQRQSIFRLLVDSTRPLNDEVKIVALNHIMKLGTDVQPKTEFTSNNIVKDHKTMALAKIVSWSMASNEDVSPELRRVAQKSVFNLFNLNSSKEGGNLSNIGDQNDETISNQVRILLEELPRTKDNVSRKREILMKLTRYIKESPDVIVTQFRPLLGKIVSMMTFTESPIIKEMLINILLLILKYKSLAGLMTQFSDLIITKVITLCDDSNKDVAKAAENCTLALSTYLSQQSIIRVIVPLISTPETSITVKLVSIKLMTSLVRCSDDDVISENIHHIMPILLEAYDDIDSSIRKATVFCIVAMYKHSDEMRASLEHYLEDLNNPKKRLLQLYINKSEHGRSEL